MGVLDKTRVASWNPGLWRGSSRTVGRSLLTGVLVGLFACNPYAADYDGDGIPAGGDCDDYDPLIGADCLESPTGNDGAEGKATPTLEAATVTPGLASPVTPPLASPTPPTPPATSSPPEETPLPGTATPPTLETPGGATPTQPMALTEPPLTTAPGADTSTPAEVATPEPCSPVLVFQDADGDGFGDTNTTQLACSGKIPAGFVLQGGDCDDASRLVFPTQLEQCNNAIDDNCDEQVDLEDEASCSVDPMCRVALEDGVWTTIQAAVNDALRGRTDCTVLWVAPGTYRENLSLSGLTIALRSEAGPLETEIDGSTLALPVLSFRQPGDVAEVSGFTLRGGTGLSSCSEPYSTSCGGAVYAENGAQPRLVNNLIIGNTAQYGGGVFAYGCSAEGGCTHLVMQENQIGLVESPNRADFGGGLYLGGGASADLTGNIFSGNGPRVTYVAGAAISVNSNRGYLPMSSRQDRFDHHTNYGNGTIYLYRATVDMDAVEMNDNVAGSGGAIFANYDCTLTLTGSSRFVRNRASNMGGAFSLQGCNLSAEGGETPILLKDNQGGNNRGGAIIASASNLTLRNVALVDNTVAYSGGYGGGLAIADSTLSLTRGWFHGNKADYGGAAYASNGSMTFVQTVFDRNQSTGSGGALYGSRTLSRIDHCVFHDNRSTNSGGKAGALWLEGSNGLDLSLSHNTFLYERPPSQEVGVVQLMSTDSSSGISITFEDNLFYDPEGFYGLVVQGPYTLVDDADDDGVSDNVFFDYLFPFGGKLSASRKCLDQAPGLEATTDNSDICDEVPILRNDSVYADIGDSQGGLGPRRQPGATRSLWWSSGGLGPPFNALRPGRVRALR